MTDTAILSAITAAVLTPTFAVVFAAFVNNRKSDKLEATIRADLQGVRTELRTELASLRTEILQLRTEMTTRFGQVHHDVMAILHLETELEKRVTRLEDAT